MNYTDTQLKKALTKILPERIECTSTQFYWRIDTNPEMDDYSIKDTELLHLCWLVWSGFDRKQRISYSISLREVVVKNGGHAASFKEDIDACCENATWKQRAVALAKVSGIEI